MHMYSKLGHPDDSLEECDSHGRIHSGRLTPGLGLFARLPAHSPRRSHRRSKDQPHSMFDEPTFHFQLCNSFASATNQYQCLIQRPNLGRPACR